MGAIGNALPSSAPDLLDARQHQYRLLGAIVGFAFAIALALVTLNLHNLALQTVLASVTTFVFLVACVVLVAGRYTVTTLFDLRLGPLFFAYACVAFGIASVTLINPEFRPRLVDLDVVPAALFDLCVAFGFATAGYFMTPISHALAVPIRAGSRLLRSWFSTKPRATGSLYFVFSAGLLADLVSAYLGGRFGYLGDATMVTSESANWYSQPLSILSSLQLAGLFGLAVVGFSSTKKASVILGPALLIAIPLGILSGMKEGFVDIAIAILIPYIWFKSRIPVVAVIAAISVFVLIITPAVTQLRGDVRGASTLSVEEGFKQGLSGLTATDGYLSNVDPGDSAMQVLDRLRIVDNYILIKSQTPANYSFRPLEEIAVAPITGIIPRAIWSDKPVRTSGYDFYTTYWQGKGQSSSAITPQGSLYMHGGLVVLFFGMFGIGVLLRATDDGLEARCNLQSAALLVVIIPPIIKQELDVPGFLASIPVLALTWAVMSFAVFKPNSKSS